MRGAGERSGCGVHCSGASPPTPSLGHGLASMARELTIGHLEYISGAIGCQLAFMGRQYPIPPAMAFEEDALCWWGNQERFRQRAGEPTASDLPTRKDGWPSAVKSLGSDIRRAQLKTRQGSVGPPHGRHTFRHLTPSRSWFWTPWEYPLASRYNP